MYRSSSYFNHETHNSRSLFIILIPASNNTYNEIQFGSLIYCILVLTLYTLFGRNFCIFLCCKSHIIQVCVDSSLFLHCCAWRTAVKKFLEKLNMQNKFLIHCKEWLEIKSIRCSIRPFVIVTCVRGRKSSILFFFFFSLHISHCYVWYMRSGLCSQLSGRGLITTVKCG